MDNQILFLLPQILLLHKKKKLELEQQANYEKTMPSVCMKFMKRLPRTFFFFFLFANESIQNICILIEEHAKPSNDHLHQGVMKNLSKKVVFFSLITFVLLIYKNKDLVILPIVENLHRSVFRKNTYPNIKTYSKSLPS